MVCLRYTSEEPEDLTKDVAHVMPCFGARRVRRRNLRCEIAAWDKCNEVVPRRVNGREEEGYLGSRSSNPTRTSETKRGKAALSSLACLDYSCAVALRIKPGPLQYLHDPSFVSPIINARRGRMGEKLDTAGIDMLTIFALAPIVASFPALFCLPTPRRSIPHRHVAQNRLVPDAITSLQSTLEWLGLDYDEGPGREGAGGVGPYVQVRNDDDERFVRVSILTALRVASYRTGAHSRNASHSTT